MRRKFVYALSTIAIILSVTGCAGVRKIEPISFFQSTTCYDRETEPYTFAVDAHVHFRPFGGPAVPILELNEYFQKTGVHFVNVFGIGQVLTIDSPCTYYLDCPETIVTPSIKNDFINAANYLEFKPQGVHMALSMTFPDLANPENVVDTINLYDKEYPGMFKWVGEVNLVKQALFPNGHKPVTLSEIDKWAQFMGVLKDRDLPMTIHSDLGNDYDKTQYLNLMKYVLQQYPDNKIVWAHMGLSKELSTMGAADHIQIMNSLLDKYPNLTLDVSWRVLEDTYFSKPDFRDLFVAFFNKYPERFIAGTDFVASRDKNFKVYKTEVDVNSRIFEHVNDEAFRNIALGENYFRILGLKYQAPKICN